MKQLKEKFFIANVDLNEEYPDIVRAMLENLYNNGSLRYDDVHIDGTEVVSERLYKCLTYGSISREALAKKEAIEKDGYHLEFIFTVAEKQQDPFIDCDVFRPENWCIREDTHYTLKLKFYYTKLDEVSEEEGNLPVKPAAKDKKSRYMFPKVKFKHNIYKHGSMPVPF